MNTNLHAAKNAKNDEFYTLYEDIEKELSNYKDHFNEKTVYCNCDDWESSNFVKWFRDNFHNIGLRRLISTSYRADRQFLIYEYDGEQESLLIPNDQSNKNGDFRSEECVELLKEADIVVTNPPFSLFREFVAQLVEYGKQFIILGNNNAITYKEIFPLIKENKLWLGYSANKTMDFSMPNDYERYDRIENGIKIGKVPAISWFTNLPTEKRNQPLDLYKTYNPEEYPKYDNYDAIEVSKVSDIPMDYDGVMGVPITFLDKYCPTQFEIVEGSNRYGILNYWGRNDYIREHHSHGNNINGVATYFRIHIKHINPTKKEF